jgi:internalin A
MSPDELLQLIDQAAAEGWTELDLAGQGLTELPPEIGKLNQLETLILGKWNVEKKYKYLGNRP